MATFGEIKFFVGDKEHTVNADVSPTTTLNSYLRDHLYLTGTKKMCLEGGCGSCLVAVEKNVDGETRTYSVNSCLVSILSCQGWKINTIESIGDPQKGYHKIQKLLAENDGSQCGFCSPGMVMNMYALDKDGPKTTAQIEDSFGGNLCRCTGYRPILAAFKQLGSDAPQRHRSTKMEEKTACCGSGGCCQNSRVNEETSEMTISLDLKNSKWIKVYTLSNLLQTLISIDNNTYRLVAGNTEKGVYKKPPAVDVYIDVSSVSELLEWELTRDTLSLGGNKSLNRTMEILRNISSHSGWKYLGTMADHIDLIAGFSIRNIATLAGNLMVRYEHHEFPSDLFLILETFNAKIVIVDIHGMEIKVSPKEFLSTGMSKRVIKKIELYRMEPEDNYIYATYKIMPRAQNAHAIVNAGFLVKIENNLVDAANIVYGAINEDFIHASATETYLVGKSLFTNEVLQGALNILDSELNPTGAPPDSSAEYKRQLAFGLFYKFVLKHAPADAIDARFASGGQVLERPLSTAVQEFGINKDKFPVGAPVHKLEILAQTSGQAEYIDDKPDLPNQLHAVFVLADALPLSKIESIDTTAALDVEGTVAVLTAEDIPGSNNYIPKEIGYPTMEKILCEDTVEYNGQPVAVVVAKSFEKALEAAALVEIAYTSSGMRPYLTIDDVIDAGDEAKDRMIEMYKFDGGNRGNDVQKVIKGSYYMGQQKAFHMELQCCSVVPTENGLIMYPATQWMDLSQISAAQALNITSSKISVFVRRLGGAFGAKVSRNAAVSCAAALAAHKLMRPVKMWLPIETNFTSQGGRCPSKMTYEVGVSARGEIQYLDGNFYTDYGIGVSNETFHVLISSVVAHAYKKGPWSFKIYNVKTDMPTNCFVRAPGTVDGIAATEAIMDHIAYSLKLDPWEVRMVNYDAQTHPLLKQLTDTMTVWGEIQRRQDEVATFNQANRWRKRALAVIPMAWILHVLPRHGVLLSVFHGDGSVGICHSGIEMGQGINTKVVQACAYKLGIDMDLITVQPSYSQATANVYCTASSMTSEVVVYNVLQACDILLERMKPVRETLTNPTWKELVQECWNVNLDMTIATQQITPYLEYPVYGVAATDVEIDCLTGQILITRADVLEDLGDSLSPLIDVGQLEGAFVMGIGYFCQEETKFDDEGKLLTPNTWEYKPPGAKDIPVNFRVKFMDNFPNPVGVLNSKAIAEPPLCLAISVPLAIRRALVEARKEIDATDNTWIPIDGPTTTEKTLLYAKNSYEHFVLK